MDEMNNQKVMMDILSTLKRLETTLETQNHMIGLVELSLHSSSSSPSSLKRTISSTDCDFSDKPLPGTPHTVDSESFPLEHGAFEAAFRLVRPRFEFVDDSHLDLTARAPVVVDQGDCRSISMYSSRPLSRLDMQFQPSDNSAPGPEQKDGVDDTGLKNLSSVPYDKTVEKPFNRQISKAERQSDAGRSSQERAESGGLFDNLRARVIRGSRIVAGEKRLSTNETKSTAVIHSLKGFGLRHLDSFTCVYEKLRKETVRQGKRISAAGCGALGKFGRTMVALQFRGFEVSQ